MGILDRNHKNFTGDLCFGFGDIFAVQNHPGQRSDIVRHGKGERTRHRASGKNLDVAGNLGPGTHERRGKVNPIMLLKSLYRFTKFDKGFQKVTADLQEKRKEQDERVGFLAKAALDHEGDWFLEIGRKNPECVIRVFSECRPDAK